REPSRRFELGIAALLPAALVLCDCSGINMSLQQLTGGCLMKIATLIMLFLALSARSLAADEVDRWLVAEVARRQMPGVADVVMKKGTVLKTGAYGLASIEHNFKTSLDTRFRLDSLTKIFTAVAILQLAEQGKLRLDDPVSKYLDAVPPEWTGIT